MYLLRRKRLAQLLFRLRRKSLRGTKKMLRLLRLSRTAVTAQKRDSELNVALACASATAQHKDYSRPQHHFLYGHQLYYVHYEYSLGSG